MVSERPHHIIALRSFDIDRTQILPTTPNRVLLLSPSSTPLLSIVRVVRVVRVFRVVRVVRNILWTPKPSALCAQSGRPERNRRSAALYYTYVYKSNGKCNEPSPCSQTPASPTCQAIRQVGTVPHASYGEGSPREVISGLNHTASALAVYASQCGSHRPTQDSLLAAGPAFQTRLVPCSIPTKGCRDVAYIAFPFPRPPGADLTPFISSATTI